MGDKGQVGEVASARSPPAARPSLGQPDPPVSALRSRAGARLFRDGVEAESRKAIGCNKSVGVGVRVRGVHLS